MKTSEDFNLHFLAKKAKNRLANKFDNAQQAYLSKAAKTSSETYLKVLKMLTSEEKIYNPIARLIGKDLKTIPDSVEKQRMVLRASNDYIDILKRIKAQLTRAVREGKPFIFDEKEIDPQEILRKIR